MKSQILPFLMAFLALAVVNAFLPPSNMPTKRAQLQTGTALVAKAKGFGEPQENQQQKKKKQFGPERPPEVEDGTTNMLNASRDRAKNMLQEMEAKEQARRDEARAKLEELREEERAIREQPDAGVIPEVVSNRMLGRILPFIAVPVVMGIGLFYFFIVLARQYEISVEPSLVAYATQAPFAVGLLGITYGVLSASWDPEIEGSALGVEEFKTNLGRIFAGIERTRDRQEFRDRLQQSQMYDEQQRKKKSRSIQDELRDMEKND